MFSINYFRKTSPSRRFCAGAMGAWLSWLAATPPLPHRLEPEAGVAQCNYEARPPPRAAHVRSPSAHLPPRRGSCCARSTAGWTRRACSTRSARARCSARCATRHLVCSSGSMMSTSTSSLARPACCCGSSRPAVPCLPCRGPPACPAALCTALPRSAPPALPRPAPCPTLPRSAPRRATPHTWSAAPSGAPSPRTRRSAACLPSHAALRALAHRLRCARQADCAPAGWRSRYCSTLRLEGLVDREGRPCCGFGFKIFHRSGVTG